jgi:hypothetical protein
MTIITSSNECASSESSCRVPSRGIGLHSRSTSVAIRISERRSNEYPSSAKGQFNEGDESVKWQTRTSDVGGPKRDESLSHRANELGERTNQLHKLECTRTSLQKGYVWLARAAGRAPQSASDDSSPSLSRARSGAGNPRRGIQPEKRTVVKNVVRIQRS